MAEKEKAVVPEIIDNVEALEAKMKAMREAQKIFATFTQEQVDKIFFEAAMAANKQRIPLAKMAVEETQRGVMEDKVIKNHYAAEYIYNAYKDTKTCGVIDCSCRYPDDKPDVNGDLQDTDLSEDEKRHHHQPASGCKEVYDRCCESRSRCRGEGRSS